MTEHFLSLRSSILQKEFSIWKSCNEDPGDSSREETFIDIWKDIGEGCKSEQFFDERREWTNLFHPLDSKDRNLLQVEISLRFPCRKNLWIGHLILMQSFVEKKGLSRWKQLAAISKRWEGWSMIDSEW